MQDNSKALLDEKTAAVPEEYSLIVAGNLSGRAGANEESYRCHGWFAHGTSKENGERILIYASSTTSSL
ncbi:hypothetical protein Y032_0298g1751 [Ancylostoma ceylanicum]|uniref:Uncharacterized protein n=1 Tax=Ancylostoma ceylanicum TaxID=53326 RepID=A0A016S507_9BILA|nr:hypothetical protein Y032_0298g1751 [Ancylostoma ceylanicum]